MRSHEPLYDQKYHPLDDFMQPSYAAKRRAKYRRECPDANNDDTTSYEAADSESESEVETTGFPSKRRKKATLPLSQCTRRSLRQTNRDVLDDTDVHPQDEDLQCMEGYNHPDGASAEEALDALVTTSERDGLVDPEILDTDGK